MKTNVIKVKSAAGQTEVTAGSALRKRSVIDQLHITLFWLFFLCFPWRPLPVIVYLSLFTCLCLLVFVYLSFSVAQVSLSFLWYFGGNSFKHRFIVRAARVHGDGECLLN